MMGMALIHMMPIEMANFIAVAENHHKHVPRLIAQQLFGRQPAQFRNAMNIFQPLILPVRREEKFLVDPIPTSIQGLAHFRWEAVRAHNPVCPTRKQEPINRLPADRSWGHS